MGRRIAAVVMTCGLGCGPGVEGSVATDTSSTTSGPPPGTTAEDPPVLDTGSTGVQTGTGTTTGECVPQVEVGAFEQVSEADLGEIVILDLDEDGRMDIVGGRGVILLGLDEGFDERVVAGWPDTDVAHVGQFDAGPELDVVALWDGTIHLFAGGGMDGATPIQTPASPHVDGDARDLTLDGIDDVVLLRNSGTAVEIWRGTPTGLFEVDDLFMLERSYSQVSVTQFEPSERELMLLEGSPTVALFGFDGAGGLVRRQEPDPSSADWFWSTRRPHRDVFGYVYDWAQFYQSHVGAGLMWREKGSWKALEHALDHPHGSTRGEFAVGDLDGDALDDLVIPLAADDASILELACQTSSGFGVCGSVDLAHDPASLEVIPGTPPRIVYTTAADGTFVAPVQAVASCP